jgi:hypothetical protein
MSEKALEILADFCDALEAAAVNVKHQIAELQGVAQKSPSWNPDKIKWVEADGTHGKYERSEDVNSLDFKALMKDLEAHQGKLSKDGFFYWKFEKNAVIGRKKQGK